MKIFFHLLLFLVKLEEWISAYETDKPLHLGFCVLVRHLGRVHHPNRLMFGNKADTFYFVKKDGEDDDEGSYISGATSAVQSNL